MKKEEPKFKVGDVVKNARNNFQRIIRGVSFVEKDGIFEVKYFYSGEKFNTSFKPTRHFNDEIDGNCSQETMLNWQRG